MPHGLGIVYTMPTWKVCLSEDGSLLEYRSFENADMVLAYVERIRVAHPKLVAGVATALETPFCLLYTLAHLDNDAEPYSAHHAQRDETEQHPMRSEMQRLLTGSKTMFGTLYALPAVKYAPLLPPYRRLVHTHMGSADRLCSIATLFQRMRLREATWTEITFFSLTLDYLSYTIVVVKDGYIVDSSSTSIAAQGREEEHIAEQAFWERLTLELAGMFSIHHIEDVIVEDHYADGDKCARKDAAIERFQDSYKFYHFPQSETEPAGFEAAFGAAILAEGITGQPGLALELAERLLPALAQS